MSGANFEFLNKYSISSKTSRRKLRNWLSYLWWNLATWIQVLDFMQVLVFLGFTTEFKYSTWCGWSNFSRLITEFNYIILFVQGDMSIDSEVILAISRFSFSGKWHTYNYEIFILTSFILQFGAKFTCFTLSKCVLPSRIFAPLSSKDICSFCPLFICSVQVWNLFK